MKTDHKSQNTQEECTLEECTNGDAIICFGNPTLLSAQRIQFPSVEQARRIGKAVNMHDELVEELQKWVEEMEGELKYGGDHNVPLDRFTKAKDLLNQASQK